MYLKKIELTGFKSFADKASMELEPGVACIVGPNGCGKSNVSDALRWVFGEQNPRLLRGTQMEDVIFNGTDERKAIGRAEVSVTFADAAGTLPLDYNEVTVTRRLFRSGESEYLINQTPCLLRNIRELFMGTGIGTNAYFLMEQGKIDMILSAKPEDRRIVFEEAAGIMKYKLKKKASLQRLELTESNLLRLSDIIREVKRQIISLERQAGRARRYQEARDELKGLDLKVARREFEERTSELRKVVDQMNGISAERDRLQTQIAELQTKISAFEKEHQSIFDEVNSLQKEEIENQHRVQTSTSELALLKERLIEFDARILADREELERCRIRRAELRSLLDAEQTRHAQFVEQHRDQKNALEQRKRDLESVLSAYEAKQDELVQAKNRYIDLLQQEAQARNQMMVSHQRQKDMVIRSEKLAAEREKLAVHAKEKEGERRTFQDAMGVLEAGLAAVREEISRLLADKNALGETAARLGDRLNAEKERLLTHTARLEAFKEMGAIDVQHGAGHESRTVLESVIHMNPEFRRALRSVLGHRLGCILAPSRQAIEKRPSASFFLLDTPFATVRIEEARGIPGFIGFAADTVQCEPAYRAAVENLLGDVVILKDEASLRGLDAAWIGRGRFVTLDGDFLDDDGVWLFDGLADPAQIDPAVIDAEIESAARNIEAIQKEKAPVDETLSKLAGLIVQTQDNLRVKELELANISGQIERLNGKIKDLAEEDWSLQNETSQLDRDIEDIEKTVGGLSVRLADMSRQAKELAVEIELKDAEVKNLEGLKEKTLVELAEVRVISRSIQEEESRFLARMSELEADLEALERNADRRREDLEVLERKQNEGASRIQGLERQIQELLQSKERLEARREEVSRQVRELTETIRGDQEALARNRADLEGIRAESASLEVRRAQCVIHAENSVQRMREKYNVELSEIELDTEFDQTEAGQRIAQLQEKLRQMGDVNLVAIQEYEEYRSRYDFLMKQQEDLVHSKDDLIKAIQKINATIREMFLTTFEQIRDTFNDIFRRLFGGGRAVLELLDENDVLECGINISAQPPGKKLQTITLLSGGEKTLTALALLLSMFKVRPSPFCFMDEMDAALDESNILRFLSLLEDFKAQTQFILITHNKKTISIADIVYGVTMELSGISKLISIRLPKVHAAAPALAAG